MLDTSYFSEKNQEPNSDFRCKLVEDCGRIIQEKTYCIPEEKFI